MSDESARLSDDARYALSAEADAIGRANKPQHLLVIAGIVFVVVSGIAGWAWNQRASAERALEQAERKRDKIGAMVAQLELLEVESLTRPEDEAGRPISDLFSRIESMAQRAGLESRIQIPTVRNESNGDAVRRRYPYRLSDPSLGNLLSWVAMVEQEIPGMQVYRLSLDPTRNGWTINVTFSRVEVSG